MSYFFGFPSLFTYEEKKASPLKSTEEEKLTKGNGEQNGQQESKDIMGSASRKGWLDWQFWKKSENSSGPFGAFRKNNKNTGAFTSRKEVSDVEKTKDNGKGEGSKDGISNVGRSSSDNGGEEGQSIVTGSVAKTDCRLDGGKSSLRYLKIFTQKSFFKEVKIHYTKIFVSIFKIVSIY